MLLRGPVLEAPGCGTQSQGGGTGSSLFPVILARRQFSRWYVTAVKLTVTRIGHSRIASTASNHGDGMEMWPLMTPSTALLHSQVLHSRLTQISPLRLGQCDWEERKWLFRVHQGPLRADGGSGAAGTESPPPCVYVCVCWDEPRTLSSLSVCSITKPHPQPSVSLAELEAFSWTETPMVSHLPLSKIQSSYGTSNTTSLTPSLFHSALAIPASLLCLQHGMPQSLRICDVLCWVGSLLSQSCLAHLSPPQGSFQMPRSQRGLLCTSFVSCHLPPLLPTP